MPWRVPRPLLPGKEPKANQLDQGPLVDLKGGSKNSNVGTPHRLENLQHYCSAPYLPPYPSTHIPFPSNRNTYLAAPQKARSAQTAIRQGCSEADVRLPWGHASPQHGAVGGAPLGQGKSAGACQSRWVWVHVKRAEPEGSSNDQMM